MNTISIIIITYNRPADTFDLLNDIIKLNHIDLLKDIIVLNNHSNDDYADVKKLIDKNTGIPFLFIDAPENLGVAKGRNYATQFAKGEIFFFIDDDVNLKDKETLQKIVYCFSANNYADRKLGVASFKVIYSTTMQMQLTAFPHKKFEKYKDKNRFRTSYYAGCAHAKLRDAWNDAGPYPEDFFYGMEEYDFSYRVLDAGYFIEYNNSFEVIHKESPLGRKSNEEKLRMMWINKSKVAWRYLPKIYFYSTAFMWSLEYLKKTGLNFKNFFSTWKKIIAIPRKEKRNLLQKSTLDYLKEVEARLWY